MPKEKKSKGSYLKIFSSKTIFYGFLLIIIYWKWDDLEAWFRSRSARYKGQESRNFDPSSSESRRTLSNKELDDLTEKLHWAMFNKKLDPFSIGWGFIDTGTDEKTIGEIMSSLSVDDLNYINWRYTDFYGSSLGHDLSEELQFWEKDTVGDVWRNYVRGSNIHIP